MPFLKGIWWYDFQDDGWQITLKAGRPDAPALAVREAGRTAFQREWGSRNWMDQTCNRLDWSVP